MKIELLAPARNAEYGRAAIDCGADALYIGGTGFSARTAAHNSIDEIALLVEYAHSYGVGVYVAMNTILMEDELSEAKRAAEEVIATGADALIVQDMAYGKMGLDIALHASTQMSCDSLARAKHLEASGFERIVLERGLTMEEIASIGKATNLEIEAFVHGAICVSTSGKCYMGHIVSSRGGNRGGCSQPCRSKWDLEDGSGNIIIKDRHLLSLKDLNLSEHLGALAASGVSSFKIEGRLKDLAYLKNSVTYYNRKVEELVASGRYQRLSHGKSNAGFEPNPEATFTRGFTTYNLLGATKGAASLDTGKSVGAYIGKVKSTSKSSFTIDNTSVKLSAGDGVVLYGEGGKMAATNINGASGTTIEPNKMAGITKGMRLYRNFDKRVTDSILSSKSRRAINITILANFQGGKIELSASDSYGYSYTLSKEIAQERPSNLARLLDAIESGLAKSGATIFTVKEVKICGAPTFLAASQINGLRRELLDGLLKSRLDGYKRAEQSRIIAAPFIERVDYKYNVTNSLSRLFYSEAGASEIEEGVELRTHFEGIDAMSSSYCLRREIGECLKRGGRRGDLYLRNGAHRFKLEFDCRECRMRVVYKERIK